MSPREYYVGLAGMRRLIFVALVALAFSLGIDANQVQPKNARDYYKELYSAGGLQKYSQYACFLEDEPIRGFFFSVIFSEEMADFLKSTPEGTALLKLLPKQEKEFIRKKSAGFYRYKNGVYMNGVVMNKDDLSSWTRISDDGKHRERFKFQPQTLRFAWEYEPLKSTDQGSPPTIFGQCERVPPDVRQYGEN
jgi:hypothetical protein